MAMAFSDLTARNDHRASAKKCRILHDLASDWKRWTFSERIAAGGILCCMVASSLFGVLSL
jgi:hypothetical protein